MNKATKPSLHTAVAAAAIVLIASGCNRQVEWPPQNEVRESLLNRTDVSSAALQHSYEFESSGMVGMNAYGGLGTPKDESDVKRIYESWGDSPNNSKVKLEPFRLQLQLTSTLGTTQVTAKATSWTKLFDKTGTNVTGWGAILSTGRVIVDRSALLEVDPTIHFTNSFAFADSNDKYCLLALGGSDTGKLLLLHSPDKGGKGSFRLVLGSVGSKASHGSSVAECNSDGWYFHGKKLLRK